MFPLRVTLLAGTAVAQTAELVRRNVKCRGQIWVLNGCIAASGKVTVCELENVGASQFLIEFAMENIGKSQCLNISNR